MPKEHMITALLFVIAIIGLILGSVSVHRTRKISLSPSDISGTWKATARCITKYGKFPELKGVFEIECDSLGFITGTKQWSNATGVDKSGNKVSGDTEPIIGIADFKEGMVYIVEGSEPAAIVLRATSKNKFIYKNQQPHPDHVVVYGELTKQ